MAASDPQGKGSIDYLNEAAPIFLIDAFDFIPMPRKRCREEFGNEPATWSNSIAAVEQGIRTKFQVGPHTAML